jgi:type II secretory pathway pseudopilin PulG
MIKKEKNKAFVLVELLVSIFIFSLIFGAISLALVNTINLQQKTLNEQAVFSEVSYAIEHVSRSLRSAERDSNGDCIQVNNTYELVDASENTIRFINENGQCHEISLENRSIVERISSDSTEANLPETYSQITLEKTLIEDIKFEDSNDSWGSQITKQPRVIFLILFKSNENQTEQIIQTTVSQRDYNQLLGDCLVSGKIGDSCKGGMIAHKESGYVMIVANEDLSVTYTWANKNEITSAYFEGFTDGEDNTDLILLEDPTGNAAAACRSYPDPINPEYWDLPNIYELGLIYDNKDLFGIFDNSDYWTSNEDNSNTDNAYYIDFTNGSTSTDLKTELSKVRCVKFFQY